MKKFYSLFIVLALFGWTNSSYGQVVLNADMELWDDASTPTDWSLAQNISQESTIVHGGTYSAGHTSAGAKKLKQVVPGATVGEDYTFSFWYYDNTDAAKVKLASAWVNSTGQVVAGNEAELSPIAFNPDDDQWHQYSTVITAPEGAAKLKIFLKVLDQGDNTGGTVYYDDFYWGPVVATPEPDNYPTGFEAATQVLNIRASWDAPTEGQLPDAYLLLGAKEGSVSPVPVDGTPVGDDMDWSDGLVSLNIASTIKSADFTELEALTAYTFTIYPYTNAGAYIDYKTDGTVPSSTTTTLDAEMISFEGFESGTSGSWMTNNVSGDQEWIFPEYGGKHTAKILGMSEGTNYANEDWLISSQLDLSTYNHVNFSFTNVKTLEGEPLKLMASIDYDGSGDPNDFNWTDLTDLATWSPGSYEFAFTEAVDLAAYLDDPVYLAFKYTSTEDAAALYKLDNMQVYSLNIIDPSIEITAPNGGENLAVGSDFEITWTYDNWVEDHFSIYLNDDGNNTLIADNVDVASGSYTWTVPPTPGDMYKIYVEAADGTNDISDDVFSIVPNELLADFEADNNVVATGNPVIFTDNSIGDPISWIWTFQGGTPSSYDGQVPPAIVYDSPGSYDVILEISDGVTTSTEFKDDYMIVGEAPIADFEASSTEFVAGASTNFTDLSFGFNLVYSWTFEGGTPGSSTDENPMDIFYMEQADATYDVTLTVSNEFGESTITKEDYIHTIPSGISLIEQASLNVYPNPASDYIFIETEQNCEVSLIDLSGKKVLSSHYERGLNKIDVSDLDGGVYFVNTLMPDGSVNVKKIIIE